MNPSVRKIISDCVRPNLWTIDGVNTVNYYAQSLNVSECKSSLIIEK